MLLFYCFFSSRRRHTRCALVTGVQTCALPIYGPASLGAHGPAWALPDGPSAPPGRGDHNASPCCWRRLNGGRWNEGGARQCCRLLATPVTNSVSDMKAENGRAHVCTPVTNAHLVCRLLLEKNKNKKINKNSA